MMSGRTSTPVTALGSSMTYPLDVAYDQQIDALMEAIGSDWDGFDVLVHSVGFAPRDQLAGTYVDSVNREGFQIAHDISSYSLAALAKAALPLMENRSAAILTLSYLGAVRAVPNYNVMGLAKASLEANVRFLAADLGPRGIRVNGISAGAINAALLAIAVLSGTDAELEEKLRAWRKTQTDGVAHEPDDGA